METERVARRHLKPQERRRVAELCERSGLTRSEFARRNGITLSSLQRWLSEARNMPEKVPAVVFREVALSPSSVSSAAPTWAVEIVGPDGTIVRCREAWSLADLVLLLRGRGC